MILLTFLRIHWIGMKRDRVVQALTFLLPIMFFSFFAAVFSNQSDPMSKVRVAVVDEDQTPYSQQLMKAVMAEGSLDVRVTATREGVNGATLDRPGAEALVRNGDVPAAVILPKGIGAAGMFPTGDANEVRPKVLLLADVSNPVAPQVVSGMLQKVAFTAAPQTMAVEGMTMFEKYTGPMTDAQRNMIEAWKKGEGPTIPSGSTSESSVGLPVEVVNVMQPDQGDTSMVSFYAAGIGVMFLLCSCSGAGGTLLEEEESGTLDRLIDSRAGMGGVLFGKWVFLMLMEISQLTVMFA